MLLGPWCVRPKLRKPMFEAGDETQKCKIYLDKRDKLLFFKFSIIIIETTIVESVKSQQKIP